MNVCELVISYEFSIHVCGERTCKPEKFPVASEMSQRVNFFVKAWSTDHSGPQRSSQTFAKLVSSYGLPLMLQLIFSL